MQFILIPAISVVKALLPELTLSIEQFVELPGGNLVGVFHQFGQAFTGHQAKREMKVVGHDAESEQFDAAQRA
jgi:hypothetical protein